MLFKKDLLLETSFGSPNITVSFWHCTFHIFWTAWCCIFIQHTVTYINPNNCNVFVWFTLKFDNMWKRYTKQVVQLEVSRILLYFQQINALNRGVESNDSFVSMPQLESLESWDKSLKPKPDIQYYIAYDFYKIDNQFFHKAPYYGFNNCK